jgi:hypothetical protein
MYCPLAIAFVGADKVLLPARVTLATGLVETSQAMVAPSVKVASAIGSSSTGILVLAILYL